YLEPGARQNTVCRSCNECRRGEPRGHREHLFDRVFSGAYHNPVFAYGLGVYVFQGGFDVVLTQRNLPPAYRELNGAIGLHFIYPPTCYYYTTTPTCQWLNSSRFQILKSNDSPDT